SSSEIQNVATSTLSTSSSVTASTNASAQASTNASAQVSTNASAQASTNASAQEVVSTTTPHSSAPEVVSTSTLAHVQAQFGAHPSEALLALLPNLTAAESHIPIPVELISTIVGIMLHADGSHT